jgi:hypothetical protein
MRFLRVAAVLGLLALTLGPTAATATVDRHTNSDWRGTTEKGGDVRMLILRTAPGGPREIQTWHIDVWVVCDDGSEYEAGIGLMGFDFPIIDGYGEFRYRPIRWTGHFSHERAHGTVQWEDSECVSEVLTWAAEHLHPAG